MSQDWQISAAELFEFARPAAWALSAAVSACVLASARRQGFRSYTVAAWAIGALFFPLIVLPLYLIARARRRSRGDSPTPPKWKYVLPILYLAAVLTVVAVFFYRDYWSLDAHLWRANNAKLRGPHSKVIAEYRAALRIADDPHTHKLLAIELAVDDLNEEALAEFRAAEAHGEPDPLLPYYTGTVLFKLGREAEAIIEYKRFLNSPSCTQALPDPNCATARTHLAGVQPR